VHQPDGDVSALLRNVADRIDELVEADILDVVVSREWEEGVRQANVTVYYVDQPPG
jgi:hypothetical protein